MERCILGRTHGMHKISEICRASSCVCIWCLVWMYIFASASVCVSARLPTETYFLCSSSQTKVSQWYKQQKGEWGNGETTGKSRSQKPKQCNKRNYNWNVPGWELVKGPNNNNMFVNWHTLEFINNSHTDGSVVLSFGNYTHELVLDSCSCSSESFFFPEQPIQCSVHVFISIPNISNCRAVFHWIACSCGT